jgi:hypothetical protein
MNKPKRARSHVNSTPKAVACARPNQTTKRAVRVAPDGGRFVVDHKLIKVG